MVQRNVQMNMEAISAMKKKGQNVNLIERKVASHAVRQMEGSVDDEDEAIERALAESKALYVSLVNIDTFWRKKRKDLEKLTLSKWQQNSLVIRPNWKSSNRSNCKNRWKLKNRKNRQPRKHRWSSRYRSVNLKKKLRKINKSRKPLFVNKNRKSWGSKSTL